ncbi:Uncharacterized protein TPAR_06293 [Tolypocladium paradoxum]|uniref:F-box domain-containing protein n=1 Tax=Tolypocladium paradoxum TaxID=94208 RepID=A0A2S4KTK4_9HYPO|nr:Uncharacterized protein TPAR_06293 [Tolypocladium paradoxum]
MTHLLLLPVEILHAICAELCLHCRHGRASASHDNDDDDDDGRCGQDALAALSATCHGLRIVAQPVLYHSPVRITNWYALVRTMLFNHYLATRIVCLPGIDKSPRNEPFSNEAIHFLEYITRAFGLTKTRGTVPPAQLLDGILLPMTPRLETLS